MGHDIVAAMLKTITLVLLVCACSSTGQVVPDPHPAAAFPGDWLQFRSDRKLTGRSRLVGNIAPPSVTTVNPGIPSRAMLPTLAYGAANVSLHVGTSVRNGRAVVTQFADLQFQNIRTSDGYSLPTFGFYFNRTNGDSIAFLNFHPLDDPGLKNIAGFTRNVDFTADAVSGASSASSSPARCCSPL